jgi:hypothetical protein
VAHVGNLAVISVSRSIASSRFVTPVSTGHKVVWRSNAAVNCHDFLIAFEFN